MNESKVAVLADELATRAEEIRTEIKRKQDGPPPYRDIYELRRTVETLVVEMRGRTEDPSGDAC